MMSKSACFGCPARVAVDTPRALCIRCGVTSWRAATPPLVGLIPSQTWRLIAALFQLELRHPCRCSADDCLSSKVCYKRTRKNSSNTEGCSWRNRWRDTATHRAQDAAGSIPLCQESSPATTRDIIVSHVFAHLKVHHWLVMSVHLSVCPHIRPSDRWTTLSQTWRDGQQNPERVQFQFYPKIPASCLFTGATDPFASLLMSLITTIILLMFLFYKSSFLHKCIKLTSLIEYRHLILHVSLTVWWLYSAETQFTLTLETFSIVATVLK